MHRFAAAVLMLIPLGGPFVNATAAAERVGGQMEVELIVEIDQGATALIAHVVVGGDEPQPAVSLDARANRTFGGFVTLSVQDAVIVFELLRPDGGILSGADDAIGVGNRYRRPRRSHRILDLSR